MTSTLTARDVPVLLEFLRDLYTIRDVHSFRVHLVSNISRLVRSEITSYNEVDYRAQRNTMFADPRDALEFPDSHRIFDQHIPEHPLIGHYARTNDPQCLKISDFLTSNKFHSMGLYTDFYRRVGVERQMAFILPARPPLVIGIALNRKGPDFNERDRLLLNLVRPHLVQAYRNAEAVTKMRRHTRLLLQGIEQSDRAVILLNQQSQVRLMSSRAPRLLAKYFPNHSPAKSPLPDILERWVRHEEENLSGTDVPGTRMPLVVDRAKARLVTQLVSDSEFSLLILEEQPTMAQADMLQTFGLTHREAEVLCWVAQGKTNADIGSILRVSPRTVHKHLEHIFQKLGVETRTAAVARTMQVMT